MTLVKFRPQKRYAFDPIFNAFFNGNLDGFIGSDNLQSNPAVNIIEGEDSIRIELAAPALSKADFSIKVEDDQLHISANKETKEEEAQNEKYLRRGFNYQYFERSFRLPDTLDTTGIHATYENGVLSLVLPKKEEAKVKPPRSIEVA